MSFNLKYDASKTCADFIKSRASRKILAGPVGGGKTSACIMAILANAIEQEPNYDGIRRSRHIITRNTVAQLRQTTQKSLLEWLPEDVFGEFMLTTKEYYLKFGDVEAEILMMPLEDEADLRRLLSLEATTIYINEGREISQVVIEGIVGAKRVGRYPSRKDGPGATYPCIMMDTNMPSFGSYHQRVMDGEEGDWETFKQPGGRSPDAENLQFLPPDYYITECLTEEHIRVFIDCLYGTSKDGQPVFRDTFVQDFHVAKEPLKAVMSSEYPLVIGLDAGLTPAAIIGQQTPSGRTNVLAECFTPKGESIGMERFLLTKLTPMLTRKFPGANAIVIVDPAAIQRSQANEETVFEIVKKAGYKVYPAPSNKIDLRIGSAETLFGQQMGGKAVLQIDPGCTGLISALSNGYAYAAKKDGEVEDKPAKIHPVSDIADGFTYFTLYLAGPVKLRSRPVEPPKLVRMGGWVGG
jgi:hypothetical protein